MSVIAGVFVCWALVNDPGGEDAKKGGEDGPDLSIFIGLLMVPLVLLAIAIVLALIPVALAIALVVLALVTIWWLFLRLIRFVHRKASERAQRDDRVLETKTQNREKGSSWAYRIRERVRIASSKMRRMTKHGKSESTSEVSEHEELNEKIVLGTRTKKPEKQKEARSADDPRRASSEHKRGVDITQKNPPLHRVVRMWTAIKHAVHLRSEQRPPRERRSQVHAALNLGADLEDSIGVKRTLAQTGPVDVSTQLRRIGWFTRMRMHRLRPH